MADSDQSVERNLSGVNGWLLVYAIGPAGFGVLAALAEMADLWRYGGDDLDWLFGIVFLIVYSVGLFLLIAVRKRFSRVYHIGLTGFMAAALAVLAFSTQDPVARVLCGNVCLDGVLDKIETGTANLLR